MPEMIIRDAEPGDLPAITDVYRRYVLEGLESFEYKPPTLEEMTRRYGTVRDKGLPYIVAYEGKQFLGYAYAGAFAPRIAYRFSVENSIYLAHDARGRGVGTKLLQELLVRCEQAGYRQMIAIITKLEPGISVALHKKLGFVEDGTLKNVGYKNGQWLDVVYMRRPLGEGSGSLPE